MLLRVENDQELARDTHSKAVINTSRENYKKALDAKHRRMSAENRLNFIEHQIDDMKNDISSILNLLKLGNNK